MFSSLYLLWLDAHDKGNLAPEWAQAHVFLTWSTAHSYKPEYGYEGKLCPESCLEALPAPEFADDVNLNVDVLVEKYTMAQLKCIASEKGIDISKAKVKKDVAELIAADSTSDPEKGG